MNSYHFMNFPASPRSWPVRPPSWASASRGCHLGGIFPWDLRLFPRIFPCFSQICPRFMKEIIRNLIRFRIGCWILLNCSELSFWIIWIVGRFLTYSLEHSFHDCFSGHGPGCFGHGLEDVLTCSTCSTIVFCWKMLNPLWCCNFNISKQNCIVADISIFFWHQAFTNIWEAFVSNFDSCLQTHPHSNWTQLVIFPTEYDHQHSSKSQLLMDKLQFSCLGSMSVFHEYSAIKYSLYPH